MAQVGIHAVIGYYVRRVIPYERRLYPAIIFGAILPDLDVIIVAIASLMYPIHYSVELFHRTFSHSFFTIIFIYLGLAIYSEFKKNLTFKIIGKGIIIGMLSHLILDIFIWFRPIDIFWPLPIKAINLWSSINISNSWMRILMIFEFFCFRWYAYFLIKKHLLYPGAHNWYIIYLNLLKKIQTLIFIISIPIAIWNPTSFIFLFGCAYIPSLIMALLSTYISRDALEC